VDELKRRSLHPRNRRDISGGPRKFYRPFHGETVDIKEGIGWILKPNLR
jgi:hypothetical protein